MGEYQEFGFLIAFSLSNDAGIKEEDAFIDRFLTEAIEANGLVGGGAISKTTSGFVRLNKRRSTADAHRQQVKSWFSAQTIASNIDIGELEITCNLFIRNKK